VKKDKNKVHPKIQLDYFKRAHPFRQWKLRLSLGFVIIAALWVVAQAGILRRSIYSPGPLSSAHGTLENNCSACHAGNSGWFMRPAADQACEKCHTTAVHHQNQIFHGVSGGQPACATCHTEHDGRNVRPAAVASPQCVQCHRLLKADAAVTARLPFVQAKPRPENGYTETVTVFSKDHPEFRVVAESRAENRKDATPIQLNHAKHLRAGLPGPNGSRVQMQCADCHRFSAPGVNSSAAPAPIEFERDCQSCHPLHFDERIPEQAPHEEPAIVNAFIRTALSKYAGRHPNEWKTAVAWHPARKLSELRQMMEDAPKNLPDWLERRSSNANQLLFGKKCRECHVIRNADAAAPEVVKPEIPTTWLSHSRFSHIPHRTVECTTCHAQARESTLTTDVLLPSRETCLTCHNSSRASAPEECVTCHIYHERR
jgi:hypothetical protein